MSISPLCYMRHKAPPLVRDLLDFERGAVPVGPWQVHRMTQLFEDEIRSYHRELAVLIAGMEETRCAFVAAAVTFVSQWYEMRARYYVQEQYEWTIRLGMPRLTEMKERVGQMKEEAQNLAQRLFKARNLWWHLDRGGGWKDRYSTGAPSNLRRVVDVLAARLSAILEAYGYAVDTSAPNRLQADAGEAKVSTTSRSPLDLKWSEEMNTQVEKYKRQLGRAMVLESKLAGARTLKQKYLAGALWDKA